mmetsp:Transcript_10127/g.19167  ORF Transcript_10127/g.19167 Transcript_10127/m.19167 type:complete len:169 (+) Transcript_10127:171-677(+)|eukprot:CAMPEP_0114233598 /NCGR_PEP_ID=MMETSP0058-20121206/5254_1 /TAXON_ID=36894 /ORGANISM="Pyramimonas parkeae, CCMP726" /LENGTH=168 /DNA_ID=CAMNT_0001345207 /DNA_START=181 /DNA_END=687 /DNA_ORIENTATION=+
MASLRFVSNPAVGIRTTALFSQRGPSPKGVTFLNARARPARELRFGYGARNSCRAPAFRYHQVWAGEARHDEEHEETSMVARVQAATESLLASGSQITWIRRAAAGVNNDVGRLKIFMAAMEGEAPDESDTQANNKMARLVMELEEAARGEVESSPMDRLRRKKDSRF